MPGHDWLAIARSENPDDVKERILTGFKQGKPFTPYVPTIELPPDIDWLLDFGCGVGRNFPYLTTLARHVAGYDLPPMIDRCRALSEVPVDLLVDDWPVVATRPFDVIFASLALQHIEPGICRSYLADFARMAPVTYLLTRVENDFGANMLDLVLEGGQFDVGDCVEVDHDPQTHQLRVLGRHRSDAARESAGTVHFEVLLRSKGPR